jgi:ribosomal protein S18 acetylase RimI-like enzyme
MTIATVVPYEHPRHHARFVELNRAWLVEHALLEHADEAQLEDPVGHFLTPGGAIFVAEAGEVVVGTAAVVPHDPGAWEVAKVAVDPAARGRGVGRLLMDRCVVTARAGGAERLVLVSNHKLAAAIAMYERMGFVHRPMPAQAYATADIYMELELVPRGTLSPG